MQTAAEEKIFRLEKIEMVGSRCTSISTGVLKARDTRTAVIPGRAAAVQSLGLHQYHNKRAT